MKGLFRLLFVAAMATSAALAQAQKVSESATEMRKLNECVGENCASRSLGLVNEGAEEVARLLKHKHKKSEAPATEAPTAAAEDDEDDEEEAATPSPSPTPELTKHQKKEKKEKKEAAQASSKAPAVTQAPAAEAASATQAPAATEAPKDIKKASSPAPSSSGVREKKIKSDATNAGVIDGSSDGSAEIDKIDLANRENWKSVFADPPIIVIKAALYAFIAYNDTKICDTFNMTLNAVEQKPEGNGTFSYHVVTDINCTKGGVDDTQGVFVLNFIPEGHRLLLVECGHREVGEIVNWLSITEEVPVCMTPNQRKKFIAQPLKHIHAQTGTNSTGPIKTDFFTRLEELDPKEVAIAGSATVALIAIIAVIMVFVARKKKAQKDLERTIAGAKAERAAEDADADADADAEAKPVKERKGLMDSTKANPSEIEEGAFVNSPSVKV